MQACSDPHHLFHKLAEQTHKQTLLRQSTKLPTPRSLLILLHSSPSCHALKTQFMGKKYEKRSEKWKLNESMKKTEALHRKSIMLTLDHTITFAVPSATITHLLAH